MQELKLYKCEFCGTSYNSKKNCEACEKGHKTPVSVKANKYLPITQNAKRVSRICRCRNERWSDCEIQTVIGE